MRSVRVRLRDGADGGRAALLVLEVAPDLPADRAGLLAGDVLLAAGDQPLARGDDLLDALAALPAGAPLQVAVGRGGRWTTVTLPTGFATTASRAA